MPVCMCIAVNEKDLVWYVHFSMHAPTKSTMCGNSDGIRVRPNKEHGDKMKQTNCKHVISRYESGDKPKITEEVM